MVAENNDQTSQSSKEEDATLWAKARRIKTSIKSNESKMATITTRESIYL